MNELLTSQASMELMYSRQSAIKSLEVKDMPCVCHWHQGVSSWSVTCSVMSPRSMPYTSLYLHITTCWHLPGLAFYLKISVEPELTQVTPLMTMASVPAVQLSHRSLKTASRFRAAGKYILFPIKMFSGKVSFRGQLLWTSGGPRKSFRRFNTKGGWGHFTAVLLLRFPLYQSV